MTTPAGPPGPVPPGTRSQRWLARLSFVLAGLAIVSLVVVAGLKSLTMLAVGLAAAVVSLAAAYFFLSRRGLWRWLSLAIFILAPIAVILVYAFRNLLWIAVLSAAIWLLASITARRALAPDQADWRMPEHPAQPPARHPYLIMNPKSGGGKAEKFELKALAASERFQSGTNLNAWLRRIMINTFISGYRKSRAGPRFVTGDAMGSLLICVQSRDGSAEDQVVGDLLDPDVIAALRELRPGIGSSSIWPTSRGWATGRSPP